MTLAPARHRTPRLAGRQRWTAAALAGIVAVAAIVLATVRLGRPAVELAPVDLTHLPGSVRTHVEAAQAAVRDDAGSAAAWGRLGVVYEAHGFLNEAIPCYARAGELDEREWRWPYFEGLCLRQSRQEAALSGFQRALALKSDHVPLLVAAGDALLRLEDEAAALQLYARARELDPGCAPAWYGLAVIERRRGRSATAAEHLQRALEIAPRYRDAHALLAQLRRELGETAAGERHAKLAAQLPPGIPLPDPVRDAFWWHESMTLEWRARRAAHHRRAGRFDAARSEWEAALADHPGAAEIHAELVAIETLAGRNTAAEQHRKRCDELAPGSPKLPMTLGATLAEAGRLDAAIAAFEEALEREPKHRGPIHHHLGAALARAGRLELAIRHLEAARLAAPDDPDVLEKLGVALADAGRFEEAAAACEQLARLDPWRVDVFDRWALALVRIGRPAEALKICREGRSLRPDNATTTNRLAWLLAAGPDASLRDGPQALLLARRLCEASGYRNPVVLDTLAVAAAEVGDFETARVMGSRALELAASGLDRGAFDRSWVERLKGRLESYYLKGRPYHGPP